MFYFNFTEINPFDIRRIDDIKHSDPLTVRFKRALLEFYNEPKKRNKFNIGQLEEYLERYGEYGTITKTGKPGLLRDSGLMVQLVHELEKLI